MDNLEELKPAISRKQTLPELSSEEFQQTLSIWLEEKGILSNLKSYMKFQMLNMLKNTVIGNNLKRKTSEVFSLAQQALHLIVAEYLLQNQCQFAFSLFSTEVNLTNIVPETKLFTYMDKTSIGEKVFDKENVAHILELVGFSKHSVQYSKLLHSYFNRSDSLLNCLVNILSENIKEKQSDEECVKDEYPHFDDDFLQNILKVFQSSNLQCEMQNQLMHNIKLCYEVKVKTFESQCIQLVNKFKKELNIRETKIKKFYNQKKSLEKQIKKLEAKSELFDQRHLVTQSEKNVLLERQYDNVNPILCTQEHCNEKCKQNSQLCNLYKREIDSLKAENKCQKSDIAKLLSRCTDLLDEVHSCQNKISLINIKIQEQDNDDFNYQVKNNDNTSVTSDSITEEIVLQAKEKLKQLEEESAQLDYKFNQLINKDVS